MLQSPKSQVDSRADLTSERLRDLLEYNPLSGEFRWRVSLSGKATVGTIAGGVDDSRGYRKISINGIRYLAHRLAWLYVHGTCPSDLIDHANGVRDDNRIENLREATRQSNGANSRLYANSTSGLKGVRWHKRDRKWCAQISVNGRSIHLGHFSTPEIAHAAYLSAARYHYGDFAFDGDRASAKSARA